MPWTDLQWDAFVGLVDEAWPGKLDNSSAASWRTLLGGFEPKSIEEGVQRLLLEGHTFRPSVSEIIAAARQDPSKPTFAEAYQLLYGPGGALRAKPGSSLWKDEKHRRKLQHEAIKDRANDMHPLVGAFIERQGIDRLLQLKTLHEEWGDKNRSDLEQQWDQHVAAMDNRDVAAIAAGGRRGELAAFDPLAVLKRAGITGALPAAGGTATS
jgi:hypothetical protein